MRQVITRRFFIASIFLASVVFASPPSVAGSTAESVDPSSGTTVTVKKPLAPTPPTVAPVTPTQVAPAAKVVEAPVTSVTSGDLTISHAHMAFKKDHIDIFFTVKNAAKADERLGGAGTTWSAGDLVEVTKDKDGKETEAAISQVLPGEKTTEFSADHMWLRMKDVKTEPKGADVLPVTLYFRRSPNAALKLAAKGEDDSSAKSVLDWLKK